MTREPIRKFQIPTPTIQHERDDKFCRGGYRILPVLIESHCADESRNNFVWETPVSPLIHTITELLTYIWI